MSYVYAGDSPDHAGSYLYSLGGLGLLGSAVPSTGEGSRAALLYNDVQASGWSASAVRAYMVSSNFPSLFVWDDSSWLASGLTPGSYQASFKVYVDGVAQAGTTQLSIDVGASILSGAAALQSVTASGAFGSAGSSGLTGAALLGEVTAAGTLASLPPSTLNGAAVLEGVSAAGVFSVSLTGSAEASPGEQVSPSIDIEPNGWVPVGSGGLASAIGEAVPSKAEYIKRSTAAQGEAIVALAETLPVGSHVVSVMASVAKGVGQIRLRLLDDQRREVGATAFQAVFGTGVVYRLPVSISAHALYVAIDGGRLFGPGFLPGDETEVYVQWVRVQALSPYDGQNVPD